MIYRFSYTFNSSYVKVSGDKLLTITDALDATVLSVDASASTGGLTLTAGPGNGATTVTGSAGADTLAIGVAGNSNISGGAGNDLVDFNATWTGADVYDGGAGTDTLRFSGALTNEGLSSTVFGGLSNVEKIGLNFAFPSHSIYIEKSPD